VKDYKHDDEISPEKPTSLFWYLPFVEFIISPYIYHAVSFIGMGFLDGLLMYASVLVRLGICHILTPEVLESRVLLLPCLVPDSATPVQ
jgi:hypothetical protein